MKRVANLYRVSTKKQVDIVKDDIPMQRIACHDFAEKMGWTIVIEKEEKPAYDLVADPSVAPTVEKLFSLVIDEGYGSHQLATWLNRQGFKSSKNADFQANHILRILHNEIRIKFER